MTPDGGDDVTAAGGSLPAALRRTVATRGRRGLTVATLLVGAAIAVAMAAGLPPQERTFAVITGTVQLIVSVAVPGYGVLLMADLRRQQASRVAPTIAAALGVAVMFGLVAAAFSAISLAAFGGDPAVGRWQHVGLLVLGSVLVQVVAQLTGTAAGALIRPPILAFLATIVVPLGLYLLLGAVPGLRPAQSWLTPYGVAQQLLSSQPPPLVWARLAVVVTLWGVLPNAYGAARLRRRRSDP